MDDWGWKAGGKWEIIFGRPSGGIEEVTDKLRNDFDNKCEIQTANFERGEVFVMEEKTGNRAYY